MQKSIWLLAFLPYLHWFGSFVNGATVLTTPSSLTRITQPDLLNSGIPESFNVVPKERGPEVEKIELFEFGIQLMCWVLGKEDFRGEIPSQAWSSEKITLGVAADEEKGSVQRAMVMYGLYYILLFMKQDLDFRSGVFSVEYLGKHVCDLVVIPKGSTGLKLAPSFAHVTQLDPPPSNSTISSSGSVENESKWTIWVTPIVPFLSHPMSSLDPLISIVGMLVAVAEPPADEILAHNISSVMPFGGVRISVSPNTNPSVLTYDFVLEILRSMANFVPNSQGQALRGEMFIKWEGYPTGRSIGVITLVPSYSSPSTSPLIEAGVNVSASTATARKKRSMASRLWSTGRS